MQKGQVRFVVCTSTLAQGVNLPIRYLIVRGLYQGRQRIRVRDFQNLIGRAGRSGMHTEGSILFAEPEIFERRGSRSGGWRWDQAKELLVPENSEPCASALLEVIEPLRSENRKRRIRDRLIVARAYVAGVEQITALAQRLHASFGDRGYSEQDLSEQIAKKEQTISAIESFLMAHGDDGEQDHDEETLSSLVEETLAFFLADNEERELLRELFQMLAAHVLQEIPEAARRITVGKTLLGVHESKQIERWVSDQRDALLEAEDEESLLSVIWPVLSAHIRNSTFVKCNIPEILQDIGRGWINGRPFCALLEALQEAGARIGGGQRPRHPKIDHAVDLCENALAYEGNLVLGAVIEMVMWIMPDESETLVPLLQRLQKRLKYGVASASAVAVHEAGFADRIVASEIASVLGNQVNSAREARRAIGRRNVAVRELLQTHPAFFMQRLEEIAARP
jgi:hypothetical protein